MRDAQCNPSAMDEWGPSPTVVPSFWASGIVTGPAEPEWTDEPPKSNSQMMADLLLTC